uniref:Uncharacterized protein n=1 Tax=Anguilla anguilla TaxID=7936 RepID=A0A0E9XF38_ANGAN
MRGRDVDGGGPVLPFPTESIHPPNTPQVANTKSCVSPPPTEMKPKHSSFEALNVKVHN